MTIRRWLVFQHIEFVDEDEAHSFVALLDGYYRLSHDYHYCLSNQVFSPIIKTWNHLKCYGPIRYMTRLTTPPHFWTLSTLKERFAS